MRVACSTSAWKGDLDHALSRVHALGFQFVDLICIAGWNHITGHALRANYDSELATIRAALDRHSLTPIATNLGIEPPLSDRDDPSGNQARLEQVDLFCRLMSDLGIATGGYYPGYRQSNGGTSRDYEKTRESIREATDVARSRRVTIGPEPHWSSNIETLEESHRLLDDLPNLTVVYDPSHYVMQGIAIESTLSVLERAHHVHLRAAAEGRMQVKLSDARAPIQWVLNQLHKIKYKGDISIEYLPGDALDPEEEIAALRDLISSY